MSKDRDNNFRNPRNNPWYACVKMFRMRSQSTAVIHLRTRAGTKDRLCTITVGTLQKEILALFLRTVAPYATTTTATYAVTPINIDQAQQWPAGKRIDILYFPPALTGCLAERWCVTQTAIPGQTAGYAVLTAILRTTRC